MKKLIPPNKKEGFVKHGVYCLPQEQRKVKFFESIKNSDEIDLTQKRLKILDEVRGKY